MALSLSESGPVRIFRKVLFRISMASFPNGSSTGASCSYYPCLGCTEVKGAETLPDPANESKGKL